MRSSIPCASRLRAWRIASAVSRSAFEGMVPVLDRLLLDEGDLLAVEGGGDGAVLARRPRSDDDHVVLEHAAPI
jgi:hypothetical protein